MRLVPGDLTDGYKISPPVVSHFSSFLFFRFFSHFIPFHISSRTQSAHKFHKNRKFTTHYLHNHITNISHITYSQENTKKHRNAHHKFTRKFDKKPSRRRRAPTPAVKCAALRSRCIVAGERLRRLPTRPQGSAPPPLATRLMRHHGAPVPYPGYSPLEPGSRPPALLGFDTTGK
jgi:hypothetical protein